MSARRSELTRQAARLFAEKGYHGTSIGDIAEALGVQKGSLYSHIASKEDLLFDTLMEGAAAFHAALDAIPDDAAAGREDPARAARPPPRGRRAARRRHRLRPGVALPRGRRAATSSSPSGAATRSGSASCFREGRDLGDLRSDLDEGAAALLLLSAANWAYTWLQPGRDTDELADRFLALLVDGMRGYSTPA